MREQIFKCSQLQLGNSCEVYEYEVNKQVNSSGLLSRSERSAQDGRSQEETSGIAMITNTLQSSLLLFHMRIRSGTDWVGFGSNLLRWWLGPTFEPPGGGGGTLHLGGGGSLNEGGDWGLRGHSGWLLEAVLPNSRSTENLRVAEVSLNGGAQPPAIGELLVVKLPEDVGDSSKGFHSVLALLSCGLSSAEGNCRWRVLHQSRYRESKIAQGPHDRHNILKERKYLLEGTYYTKYDLIYHKGIHKYLAHSSVWESPPLEC